MWGGRAPHRSSYSLSLFDFVDFSFVHRFIQFLAFFENLEFFRLLLDLDLDFGLGLGLGLGEGDEATGDGRLGVDATVSIDGFVDGFVGV